MPTPKNGSKVDRCGRGIYPAEWNTVWQTSHQKRLVRLEHRHIVRPDKPRRGASRSPRSYQSSFSRWPSRSFSISARLRLSPYRLVLIATFIPCLVAWLSLSAGRIRLPDILMLLTATWPAIALIHLHGVEEAIQPAGIFVIETFGTFLFARRHIRDVFAFQRMVRCLVLMVLVLLPFAAYETLTGSPILINGLV